MKSQALITKLLISTLVLLLSTLSLNSQNKTSSIQIVQESEIKEEISQVEEWMLDDNFWKIEKQYEWDIEPIEEEMEVEEWMSKFSIKTQESQSDITTEKEWMKKHSFYIL